MSVTREVLMLQGEIRRLRVLLRRAIMALRAVHRVAGGLDVTLDMLECELGKEGER